MLHSPKVRALWKPIPTNASYTKQGMRLEQKSCTKIHKVRPEIRPKEPITPKIHKLWPETGAHQLGVPRICFRVQN